MPQAKSYFDFLYLTTNLQTYQKSIKLLIDHITTRQFLFHENYQQNTFRFHMKVKNIPYFLGLVNDNVKVIFKNNVQFSVKKWAINRQLLRLHTPFPILLCL